MEIKFTDMDIVDINLKVAEQCLIKASVENNTERKIKSIIIAKKSLDNILNHFDINEDKIKIIGLPSKKANPNKNKQS